jgi:hypothetical protein
VKRSCKSGDADPIPDISRSVVELAGLCIRYQFHEPVRLDRPGDLDRLERSDRAGSARVPATRRTLETGSPIVSSVSTNVVTSMHSFVTRRKTVHG